MNFRKWLVMTTVFVLLISSITPPIQVLAIGEEDEEFQWIEVLQSTEVYKADDKDVVIGHILEGSILISKEIDKEFAYLQWMNEVGVIQLTDIEILDMKETPNSSPNGTNVIEEELILNEEVEVTLRDGEVDKGKVRIVEGPILTYKVSNNGYLINIGELEGAINPPNGESLFEEEQNDEIEAPENNEFNLDEEVDQDSEENTVVEEEFDSELSLDEQTEIENEEESLHKDEKASEDEDLTNNEKASEEEDIYFNEEAIEGEDADADAAGEEVVIATATTIASSDRFFEVVSERALIYDNSTGVLVEVGTLQRGQVYPRIRDYGPNWHEIKFGSRTGYVSKSATRPATGSALKNINTNYQNSDRNFTALTGLPVYDNTSGSLIQFGTIQKDVKYPIVGDYGNWYRILLSDRVGYVSKANAEEGFKSSDQFFEVTRNGAPIYDNSTGALVQVGTVQEGQVYPRVRDYGPNWHEIKFGSGTGYVSKSATRPATGSALKNINTNYQNSDRNFTALTGLPVYDNTSGSLVQFGTIQKDVKYPIVGDYGNWYRILLSDRVGYVSKANAEEGFKSSDRFFEVTRNGTPIYDNSTGALVQVGTVQEGQVYPRIRDYGPNWHEIKFGSGTGYVSKSATRPATGASLRNINTSFQNSNGLIKPLNNVIVYDNSSGNLVQYGTLLEGVEYPVVSDFGGWYRILLADRVGFVNKNQVELTRPIQPPVREVVNARQTYTYDQMQKDIQSLAIMYPELIQTRSIGKSVDGRELYAIKLGKGQTEVFFNGSNHAREHMTTNVLMKMIDDYARAYTLGNQFDGYNVRTILDQTSIWFVPMMNPDGVTLVQKGHTSAKNPQEVLRLNNGSTNFDAWKANIRGVDLNRQFPALWNTISNNPGRPGPQNYKGPNPLSEPEAKAVHDFAFSRDFKTAISYHSSGEVIYARFDQEPFTRSIAAMVSRKTGYSPIDLQNSTSGGGFTDWFILNQRKPGLTPEISPYVGPRPVPNSSWDRIWSQNNSVGLMIAQEAYQNRNRR